MDTDRATSGKIFAKNQVLQLERKPDAHKKPMNVDYL